VSGKVGQGVVLCRDHVPLGLYIGQAAACSVCALRLMLKLQVQHVVQVTRFCC
jgi:hypothetical protein